MWSRRLLLVGRAKLVWLSRTDETNTEEMHMNDTVQLNESEQKRDISRESAFDILPLSSYAAELAEDFRSFANKLDVYYAQQGYAQSFLVPRALAIDIRMTRVRLEGLERLCRAWLDEFLAKVEEV